MAHRVARLDRHLADALKEREKTAERSINFVRAGFIAVALVLDIFSAVREQLVTAQYLSFTAAILVVTSAYVSAIHLFSRKGRDYRAWVKYLAITFDHALLVAYFVEMAQPQYALRIDIESVIAVTVVLFIIINVLNALRLSPWAILYSTALGTGIVLVLCAGFSKEPLSQIWFPALSILGGGVTFWISRSIRTIIHTLIRREKLSRFLPQEVVSLVESTDLELALGGKSTRVTVLFCDIRGFTHLSEKKKPEEIVTILNTYFTRMCDVIQKHGGMIDKYMGDAVMAVFGAPLSKADDAHRAVKAAHGMLGALEELNAEWQGTGGPVLSMGIALHSGVAVAGNIGTATRMDYTVIGDTVNLASRMESLNKVYGTRCLLSEETRADAGELFPLQFVAESPVRGRDEPVRLYTFARAAPSV